MLLPRCALRLQVVKLVQAVCDMVTDLAYAEMARCALQGAALAQRVALREVPSHRTAPLDGWLS